MPRKGYALSESEARDFNRMRANFRRRAPAKARRSPRRRRHGGGPLTDEQQDDGFPDGVTCDCDHCLEGVTIPDGTECCKSHTTWSFTNPWLTCATTDLLLHYAGTDRWVSDEFAGPEGDPNTYRWVLTVDVDGLLAGVPNYTALTLTVAQDNGGDPVCLVYGRVGFDCQCDNSLTRKKPYGKVHGVELNDTSCNVCLKPENIVSCTRTGCEWLEFVLVELPSGVWSEGCDPDVCGLSGDHYLISEGEDTCAWSKGISGGTAGCGGVGTSESEIRFYIDHIRDRIVLSVRTSDSATDGSTFLEWTLDGFACDGVTTTATLTFYADGSTGAGGCEVSDDLSATEVIVHLPSGGTATDSGACEDEDCIPGIPPTNPAGGCCFGGYCLDFVDEALCNEFGGGWSANIDDCLESCNPTGSCCVAGGCFLGTQQVCDLVGGTFAAGAHCDDNPCEDGACCRGNGTCEVVPEAACNGAGDHWYGAGTNCTGKSCEGTCCCDGPETCCYGQGFTYDECIGDGSTPTGEVYACSETPTWVIDSATCNDCVGAAGC